MKKHIWIAVVLAIIFCLTAFAGCDLTNDNGSDTGTDEAVAASDSTFDSVKEATNDFIIATEDGQYTESNGIYSISKAGTYSLSGMLNGQISVDASDAEVILELNGTTITCSFDSPIKVVNADKVEISAKIGTDNVIKDTRSEKPVDESDQGLGAIYAKCDLKLKGNGTLVIQAGYNNGVHTTKDLTVKNLSLKVTAVNNALKGNDSVTVESGTLVVISTKGDGIKTEDTDVSSKGKQRGTVAISDGTISVYAAGDGIQASYDFVINGGSLSVYTGSYSAYTASVATTTSYKGVKVGNELTVNAGTITLCTYDDGLHADHGTALENGNKGLGNINICGGQIKITVYSPAKTTGGGRQGPGGWNNQQSVSGADGIHADNTLTVSGGVINVDSAYEGLEANHVIISGGKTYVSGNDDGINASKKIKETPTIVVSGGYLDVTVSPNGDTDGIDSNGNYTQTGGVVVTRGPSSEMSGAIDADGTVTISGGTLIVLGYGNVKTSGSGVKTYSLSLHSSGSHTVKIDGTSYTFINNYSYSKTTCYSSVSVSA